MAKGHKTGGRQKGSRNKRTQEREAATAAAMALYDQCQRLRVGHGVDQGRLHFMTVSQAVSSESRRGAGAVRWR
jgi:hypothetical protein